jgi:hypothetical protein
MGERKREKSFSQRREGAKRAKRRGRERQEEEQIFVPVQGTGIGMRPWAPGA